MYTMKLRVTLLLVALFTVFGANAQQNAECMEKLSIFTEAAKVKNYDAAYEPWMFVRKTCPKLNNAIYVYGERILKDKLKKAPAGQKTAAVNALIALHKESMVNMPARFKKGKIEAKIGQLQFDNKIGTPIEQFNTFDAAYKADAKNFKNPKSLFTYFKLMVGLYDAKQKNFQDLVDLYTVVTDKIEAESKTLIGKKDALLVKEEAGTITSKEKKKLKSYDSFLNAYVKISKGIDKELGDRAGCDKLVPLFEKNFEANKSNTAWLKNSAGRLSGKDCADAPIFVKLVEALHNLEPSAKSAYYLGILSQRKKDYAGAEKYFGESAKLYTENTDKAKVYQKLATLASKRGQKAKARGYAEKALRAQPSFGKAYLLIANLYAKSANNCGTDSFSKRATFWLAANVAEKAGRVDGSLKRAAAKTAANYRAKAPSKQDVFVKGNAGQKLTIGCWINRTITVPNL